MRRWVERVLVEHRERAGARWLEAGDDYRDAMERRDVEDVAHTLVVLTDRRAALRRADWWLDRWVRR